MYALAITIGVQAGPNTLVLRLGRAQGFFVSRGAHVARMHFSEHRYTQGAEECISVISCTEHSARLEASVHLAVTYARD